MMIFGKIIGSREYVQKLAGMTDKLKSKLRRGVLAAALIVQAATKADKLSGQVLKVRTGKLRRSVNIKQTESSSGVYASVGTNVEYAKVHEFGFRGAVQVKEHMRRQGGSKKKVRVRAHTRQVKLPERSFLRSALRDKRNEVKAKIAGAVAEGVR